MPDHDRLEPGWKHSGALHKAGGCLLVLAYSGAIWALAFVAQIWINSQ